MVGHSLVIPWLILSATAKPVANRPAATRNNHAIAPPPAAVPVRAVPSWYRGEEEPRCACDGAPMENARS
jgi:hypothetical protein